MKKIITLMLCAVLAAASVPAQGYAMTTAEKAKIAAGILPQQGGTTTDPSDEKLLSAIVAVKKVITIPEEYSNFNYYFTNTNSHSDSYWSLTWTKPDDYAVIQVNCDLDNHIMYYNKSDNKNQDREITKYLKSELKSTADKFIDKIAPETSGSLEYKSSDYQGIYNNSYTYYYERKNNGVAFPDNNVSVSVNCITGEVVSANISWLYGTSIPSSNVKITKDKATELIKKNMKMKLVYRSNHYYYYRNDNSDQKAFLVYEPTENYISVDAKTGEIYKTRNQWAENGRNNINTKEAATMDSASGKSASVTLTEEEITKVEELKKLISKSDAIKTVTGNKYLYLDKSLSSYSATLEKMDYGNSDASYVWNITLRDPKEVNYEKDKDTYRAYAYACVDAKTGKILSFYASLKSNYDDKSQKWNTVKIVYNKAQGKAILEKFLKNQISNYFGSSVLSEQADDYIAYYVKKEPEYGGYRYQYNRVNEGVEFPDNNINGSVDGVTGKIYSYGYNWDKKITFESAKGVISADAAMNYYLGKDGYGLKYEINTINNYNSGKGETVNKYYENTEALKVNYEIRLVYRPDITPSYISPFTGEQLNMDGTSYKIAHPYSYKDIESNEKNRNILLLADMNIGFEGENFQPDKYITFGELKQLLSEVGYDSSMDTYKPEDLITREQMAQMFINQLGLQKMAKLSGIYKTGYLDENEIGSEYLGAVALAKGLKFMEGNGDNYFYPKKNITRYDAVNVIMNYIGVQRGGIYY